MGEDYVGRTVYTLDGFQRGTITHVEYSNKIPGSIVGVVVKLDTPAVDRHGNKREFATWFWVDCKLA